MSEKPDMLEAFLHMNSEAIDERGISPTFGLAEFTADSAECFAFACDGHTQMQRIKELMDRQPRELIFGLDRFCKPNQGTTLKDALSISWFKNGVWRFGVMEYQHEPRIVQPVNWDNVFWNNALRQELESYGIKGMFSLFLSELIVP